MRHKIRSVSFVCSIQRPVSATALTRITHLLTHVLNAKQLYAAARKKHSTLTSSTALVEPVRARL